jgi:hypothetical protein
LDETSEPGKYTSEEPIDEKKRTSDRGKETPENLSASIPEKKKTPLNTCGYEPDTPVWRVGFVC